ncbi:phosphate ABC transporter ATP-binding protein, PhoT family (TC 3.A.1.7.1) [Armatimonadetes bacterium GBS]|jgi:phosphate transport system ATP-binding protein|nr:phosphate ABC transporter ATP-binding protein, PhoT family (TC 3.A.1.7.1) [Armatimonadetes bacterium GBS]CUU38847.1 phosphate ABC transporter ATP-binding protein, PhoT family (TC 3.A.1.7.1) [Armatimonadetes bacterium GXS]
MIAAMTLPKQKVAMETVELSVSYNGKPALKSVSLAFPANAVTALIGPSGCGKSTLLRCLNRMNDRIPGAEITGKVMLNGEDIYARRVNLTRLRREVGMVFQKPNPFPMSIFENVALGPRLHYGLRGRALQEVVEDALRKAALWDEVKDELHKSGLALSGGQQQRLCIARMLAVQPRILLMDEPCSALDPISTQKIEELIVELGKQYTVIVVTHNLQQAARISHYTGFLMYGELVEWGETRQVFENPTRPETEDYIRGRFG